MGEDVVVEEFGRAAESRREGWEGSQRRRRMWGNTRRSAISRLRRRSFAVIRGFRAALCGSSVSSGSCLFFSLLSSYLTLSSPYIGFERRPLTAQDRQFARLTSIRHKPTK